MARWSSRTGVPVVLLAVIGVTQACSGRTLDTSSGSGVPPGCEAVLGQSQAGQPPCNSFVPAQCAQVRQDAKTGYEFTISFTPTTNTKAANCLAGLLRSRGAQATVESWNGLGVTGSFEAMEPALGYDIVASYTVIGCIGGCTYCSTLSADQCSQDAFCGPITARQFNPTKGCLEPVQNIGCQQAPNGCIPEPSAFVDLQGACWNVDCGGQPVGWTATGGQSCSGSGLSGPNCP